jgi:hypothetical protein
MGWEDFFVERRQQGEVPVVLVIACGATEVRGDNVVAGHCD